MLATDIQKQTIKSVLSLESPINNFYTFDKVNEVDDDDKNIKDASNIERFINFVSNKESNMLKPSKLFYFMKAWCPSKALTSVLKQHNPSNNNFYSFNALDHKGKKQQDDGRKYNKHLINFFVKNFSKNNKDSIVASVSHHKTFFVEFLGRKDKKSQDKEKDIIAAVSFICDDKKENVFIC